MSMYAEFDRLLQEALHGQAATIPPPAKRSVAREAEGQYISQALNQGQFTANVIATMFKGIMGPDMATSYAEELMSKLFREFAPTNAVERLLIEHVGALHAQLQVTRVRWAGATDLDDIERLTRIQNRLDNELGKLIASLADLRQGARLTIQANFANNQAIINQPIVTSEVGSKHA